MARIWRVSAHKSDLHATDLETPSTGTECGSMLLDKINYTPLIENNQLLQTFGAYGFRLNSTSRSTPSAEIALVVHVRLLRDPSRLYYELRCKEGWCQAWDLRLYFRDLF